jgi:hypothetical protein
MMSRRKRESYVSLPLPKGVMDCRVKPGNDGGEAYTTLHFPASPNPHSSAARSHFPKSAAAS